MPIRGKLYGTIVGTVHWDEGDLPGRRYAPGTSHERRGQAVNKDTVQRVWSAHGLKPCLVKTFKVSNDPRFAALDMLEGKVIGTCMQS